MNKTELREKIKGLSDDQALKELTVMLPDEANADLYCEIGKIYMRMNEFEQAGEAYRKGLEIDPENESLQVFMGILTQTVEVLGKKEIEDAAGTSMSDEEILLQPERLLDEVEQQLQSGNIPGADMALLRMIDLGIGHPRIQLLYGIFLRETGDEPEAVTRHLHLKNSTSSIYPEYELEFIKSLTALNRSDEARYVFGEIEQRLNETDKLYVQAWLYHLDGMYRQSNRVIGDLLKLPLNRLTTIRLEVLRLENNYCLDKNDWKEQTVSLYEKYPESPDTIYWYARMLEETGQLEKAVEITDSSHISIDYSGHRFNRRRYIERLKLSETDAYALIALHDYLKKHEWDADSWGEIACVTLSILDKPTDPFDQKTFDLVKSKLICPKDELLPLLEAKQKEPLFKRLSYYIGTIYLDLRKDAVKAASCFRRHVEDYPQHVLAWNQLVKCYELLKDDENKKESEERIEAIRNEF
jgi:tetratricopeptide (TPR) repeat protein